TSMASSFDDVRQQVRRREPDCIVLSGGLHEDAAIQLLVAARDRSISTLGLVEATEPDAKGLALRLGLTAWLSRPVEAPEVVATIFLDEVGEMSPATQGKLLRVLEDREFFRVGGTQPIRVDVRVISATNKSLKEAVALGQFRDDLYYRLNVLSIYLPPLRERRTDIPLLVRRFIAELAAAHERKFQGITPEALQI